MSPPFLDMLSPDFRPDSREVMEARDRSWYARTPIGYSVLRYREADDLIGDRRLRQSLMDFLESQGIVGGPLHEFMASFIATLEGPEHTRLRRLVAKAFTRRSVDRLRPAMREVANQLVDGFGPRGECDFMEQFADPFSARIICRLLGVPAEQQERFRGWANDLGLVVSNFVVEYRDRIESSLHGLQSAVEELLRSRSAAPRDDLLTHLLASRDGGDRLTLDEVRTMVTGLLLAGQDATAHQLGRTMETFLDHPAHWDLLAERPELATRAVEEVMRTSPTATAITRIAATTFRYADLEICEGEFLTVLLDPVHTDPAVFSPAFDITRDQPAQLTFGGGPHFCLGAVLARAEMCEALPILARRLRGISRGGRSTWRPIIGITGPTSLPLRFVAEGPS